MALNADELSKSFVALSERFSGLAETLAQTAGHLQGSGTLPAESLLDEIAKVRTDFVDVRQRVLEAARSLSINAPGMSEIDSLKALGPVLETVVQALAVQEKRAALAEARTQVMAVLDRVLTVSHVDGPNFGALVQCQAKAREIRQAALDPKAFDGENAPAFLEGTPSFAALLSMIEGREALDDEKFAALEDTVTQSFGRTLAVAATRGKLVVGAPPAPVPERPAQPAPKTPEPAARPAAAPPSPAPAPEPVAASAPTARAGAEQREAAQAVEHAAQDEAAQWWVSAWARWTSWKGTLSFADAVKEELGKYNYILSVPIQKSTDYEEGLLAYGYSILLEHIDHRDPDLHAPEQPDRRSRAQFAAAHAGAPAVRRPPVPDRGGTDHVTILCDRRRPSGAAIDRREAPGRPQRLRSRVALDHAAGRKSRPQVRDVAALSGGNVGAGAGEGLRDPVGGGVQSRPAHGEEVRSDAEPQAVGQAGGRYLPLGQNRVSLRASRDRMPSAAPPASGARAVSPDRLASAARWASLARMGSCAA